jgi:tetratricopeptide (TPR) repeat protein
MQRRYARFVTMRHRIMLAVLGSLAIATVNSGATAQVNQSPGDPSTREFGRRPGAGGTYLAPGGRAPAAAPNASLDSLNKILSSSQLSPLDRSVYLSIRAFQLTRLGREAESQKDVAEMARLAPTTWTALLATSASGLAGGGDRAASLRMLDNGLARKPGDTWLLLGQAEVNMQLADHARALGLLDNAVAGASGTGEWQAALYLRGHANFNLGNFAQSIDDFDGTLAGRTALRARVMPALWRYAAQVMARRDARGPLAKAVGTENLSEWPGPIARFLLGQISAGELEVAAESDVAAKRINGKCPAAFFIGIDALRRGDKQRAREQFQLAQARCSTVVNVNWAAASELKRL